ncbi:MAG: alpha/beta fold hydrolase [Desulfotalea sp.]
MKYSQRYRQGYCQVFTCVTIAFLMLLPGCSLKKYMQQAEEVENIGFITGEIDISTKQKGSVIAILFKEENGIPLLVRERIVSHKGEFKFTASPGKYYVAAYIDENQDGKYQAIEHGNFYGSPSLIKVTAKEEFIVPTVTIFEEVTKTDKKAVSNLLPAWENNGSVVTLNDPRFGRENYTMGLWRPIDFLGKAEGGLFFLGKYKKNKIPIIFIHGANGGPKDWANILEKLDNNRFQPWVFYYPSGLRIDMVSDYLVEAINRLQNRYEFSEFVVVGHSMGGLVSRAFVKDYIAHTPDNIANVKMVMTINSPMDGMESAAIGVRRSPIVIPSWRDVATGSEFLKDINGWDWPKIIPYHLIVSYETGRSGDGVVPLQSQASPKLQAESSRLYLFNNDHAGTLSDSSFIKTFNNILEKVPTKR